MIDDQAGSAAPGAALALAAAVCAGRRSALDECEERLALAERRHDLGAFWLLDAGGAREAARAIDAAVAAGRDPGPLAGVPVAFKDCFDVAGLPTTAGAPFLGGRPAHDDALAVARLRRAGAVSLGKLAMHQLAWGMTGQSPARPPCRNPADPGRLPGGSSSGSAVAVAAGLVELAPGTDAGGSIRVPAALCGVAGLMPSPGLVPLDGCVPYCPTFDRAGTIARDVAGCAAALDALAGRPPRERSPAAPGSLRIGVLGRHFGERLDAAVASAFASALGALERAGASLPDADLCWQEDPDAMRAVFDAEPLPLVADAVGADPDAFGADIRADVERGLRTSALDYLRALRRLRERRRRAGRALAAVDVVACPTVPVEAPPFGGPDPTATLNRNTKPFNGLGWPAISLPCGRDSGGRPVGLQLAAAPGADARLIAAALAVEACVAELL